jgi:ubiquinone/menaquinone biosynthesis C-methylase UbiE
MKPEDALSSIEQGTSVCPPGGWAARFFQPYEIAGRFVGNLLAWKSGPELRFAIEALDLQPEDQVLEIGFGSGHALGQIAARVSRGVVIGVDPSEEMVIRAARRHRELITSGRMQLELGGVEDLPFTYKQFTKVLAENNFHLWPNQERNLVEVQRVMKKSGQLIITQRMRQTNEHHQSPSGIDEEERELIEGLLRWVGFRRVRSVRQQLAREIVCVIAER